MRLCLVTSFWGMRNLSADTTSWIISVAHEKDQQERFTYAFNHAFQRDHNTYLCLGEGKSGHTLQQDEILVQEHFHTMSLSWEKRAWRCLPTSQQEHFLPWHSVWLPCLAIRSCFRFGLHITPLAPEVSRVTAFFLKVSLHHDQWSLPKGKGEGIFREQCMWKDSSQLKGL